MPKSWQWDMGRSDEEIQQILKNPGHPSFLHYASLLLSRTNVPKEVFSYLEKKDFCIEWQKIKRRMHKDRLAQERIQFWQEIYRHLKEDFKAKGIMLRQPPGLRPAHDSLRVRIGKCIREIRLSKKITQADFAREAGLTQQFVSKIEQGTENISLDTLERIQKFLKEDLLGRLRK